MICLTKKNKIDELEIHVIMSNEDAINFLIRNVKKNIQPVFKFPSLPSINFYMDVGTFHDVK